MESQLDGLCSQAIDGTNRLSALKKIREAIEPNMAACEYISTRHELILPIIQIVTDAFYLLNTEQFNKAENFKVQICFDIFQSLVRIPEYKAFFLEARLDSYVYPFILAATEEPLRVSTLKLFRAILEKGMAPTMRGGELLPLLLKIIDFGSEVSQGLSLETLFLILQGSGLEYAVQTLDRFQAIDVVLSGLMTKSIASKNLHILKNLFKVYLRLCDKPNVRNKLKEKMPELIDSKDARELDALDKDIAILRESLLKVLR